MTREDFKKHIAYCLWEHRKDVRKQMPEFPFLSVGDDKTDWEEAGSILEVMEETQAENSIEAAIKENYMALFGDVFKKIER
jgi:hypothetical protein